MPDQSRTNSTYYFTTDRKSPTGTNLVHTALHRWLDAEFIPEAINETIAERR
jgi:hypothetical protein